MLEPPERRLAADHRIWPRLQRPNVISFSKLYHHESLTRGADDTNKKRERARSEADYMRKRWGSMLDNDPAYNTNLTLIYEDFSLK